MVHTYTGLVGRYLLNKWGRLVDNWWTNLGPLLCVRLKRRQPWSRPSPPPGPPRLCSRTRVSLTRLSILSVYLAYTRVAEAWHFYAAPALEPYIFFITPAPTYLVHAWVNCGPIRPEVVFFVYFLHTFCVKYLCAFYILSDYFLLNFLHTFYSLKSYFWAWSGAGTVANIRLRLQMVQKRPAPFPQLWLTHTYYIR